MHQLLRFGGAFFHPKGGSPASAAKSAHAATGRAGGRFDITEAGAEVCGPGDIDIVAPGVIHSEYAGDEKSIAFIVRSQRSGTFEQCGYLDDGSRVVIRGPNQVPFELN